MLTKNNFLHKTSGYFKPKVEYWQATPNGQSTSAIQIPGQYHLDFTLRLKDGHFDLFDKEGLPIRPHRYDRNRFMHYYSTLCTFALAHLNVYMDNGSEDSLTLATKVSDYLVMTCDMVTSNHGILRGPGKDGLDHTGMACALTQGMGLSVLSRVWFLTKNRIYLQTAESLLTAFDVEAGKHGVRGYIAETNTVWYEEEVLPPKRHILNGMIYALFGLYDLAIIAKNPKALDLFREGVDAVIKVLPLFNKRGWSLYWIPGENAFPYVASMNYHNLHIVQLHKLHEQTNMKEFLEYEKLFAKQANSLPNRIQAMTGIVSSKQKLKALNAK